MRRAGVAQGTFYLYFGSKRDALLELARRPMEEVAARMESAIATVTSFEGRIRAAARTAFEIERPNMDLCRLMTQAEQSSNDRSDHEGVGERVREQLAPFLRRDDRASVTRGKPNGSPVLGGVACPAGC